MSKQKKTLWVVTLLFLSLKTYISKPNIFFVQVVAELPSGWEHKFTSKLL